MHKPASENRTAKNTKTDDWSSAFFTTTKVEPQRKVQKASASSARNRRDMPKDRLSQDCAQCKGFLVRLVRKGLQALALEKNSVLVRGLENETASEVQLLNQSECKSGLSPIPFPIRKRLVLLLSVLPTASAAIHMDSSERTRISTTLKCLAF